MSSMSAGATSARSYRSRARRRALKAVSGRLRSIAKRGRRFGPCGAATSMHERPARDHVEGTWLGRPPIALTLEPARQYGSGSARLERPRGEGGMGGAVHPAGATRKATNTQPRPAYSSRWRRPVERDRCASSQRCSAAPFGAGARRPRRFRRGHARARGLPAPAAVPRVLVRSRVRSERGRHGFCVAMLS
jgi:hypothetical protein